MSANCCCPLCKSSNSHYYLRDKRREYWCCDVCSLVFVLPEYYLSTAAEKREYDLHENSSDDEGYRRFLGRLADPLLAQLATPVRGLDFGCGPVPVLADMLREAGHELAVYDYFYHRDVRIWEQRFDFITATEVFEHLHNPGQEVSRLWKLLKPGGYLAIMTKLVVNAEAFSHWHYKNDLTHVCFFSRTTFSWLAEQYSASLEFIGNDVIFLRKRNG